MFRRFVFVLLVFLLVGCGEKKKGNFHYFRNYSRTFNDMHERHIKAAKQWGVEPLDSHEEIVALGSKLVEVKSSRLLEIDKLTYSEPYLVPEAYRLLLTISENFRDSLSSKGLPLHKPVVTSVLRTRESVGKLRKKNINASPNSVHMYGTTFDIAYTRFKPEGRRSAETDKLKTVLAEVLRDLRKSEKCYVRYEYKQCCFHITVR